MIYWQTIHAETRDGFNIACSVAPEEDAPRNHFDDDGETARAIADGRFEWFMVRVDASREGIVLGSDYLGGCCYESASDFIKDNDYYADMVEGAIAEARATLARLATPA